MNTLVAIALGGSVGALARFWTANAIYGWLGRDFPVGTLFVNVSGSFLMGFLTELMLQRFSAVVEYRAAVLIGFLGAYTTFSTFAIESFYLIEQGGYWKAAANMLLSVVLCVAAVWVGLIVGRKLFAGGVYFGLGQDWVYGRWLLILTLGGLAGLCAESVFRRWGWAVPVQAIALVVILGLTATGSALAVLPGLASAGAGWSGLVGGFAASALGSAVAVGLGLYIGRQL